MSSHPLSLLTADEISAATIAVRESLRLKTTSNVIKALRWIDVSLEEPETEAERNALLSDPHAQRLGSSSRRARVTVYDSTDNMTYEAIVALIHRAGGRVDARVNAPGPVHMPGVQPAMTLEEYALVEDLCRSHPGFIAAVAKRGFKPEHVCVDPWCVGYFSEADGPKRRLAKPLVYVRDTEDDNLYARPLEGLNILIDMQHGTVAHFEDLKMVPVPPRDAVSASWVLPEAEERRSVKALHVVQPDGPGFTLDDGNHVSWEGWAFRVGFSPREGAVLQTVTYADPLLGSPVGGAKSTQPPVVRPVAYRLSVAEMVVPYGDPNAPHYVKNAFDAGEDGLGRNAHSLQANGCDCLGDGVRYLDAALVSADGGRGETLKNAICIHEEDSGVLWKHMDWRSGQTEVRRGRRLVVSFICTIANYEYGFYYHLGMDGAIDVEVKLTGVLSTGALAPEELQLGDAASKEGPIPGRKYGLTLSREGLYAPIHQHFFVARLDMAVDGLRNTVVEVDTVRAPPSAEENPFRNAFFATEKRLATETAAVRDCSVANARHWKIESSPAASVDSAGNNRGASDDDHAPILTPGGRRNRVGTATAYALHPHTGVLPFAAPDAHFMSRAGFLQHHLWVTPFAPSERFPGGDYPNQRDFLDGLPLWTRRNRCVADTDIVLWYVFGVTHVPRLEDWPVMPVERTGFSLRPTNFFDRSPALDVPPASRIPRQQLVDCNSDACGIQSKL